MAAFTSNSQHLEGAITVAYYAPGSDAPVSVAHVLPGELNWRESQWLPTLGIDGRAQAFELDAADLGAVVPVKNGRIVVGTGASEVSWRIVDVRHDHVIGVYRCLCGEAR